MTEEEFNTAESFWERRDEREAKLPEADIQRWIDGFLGSHKVLALATACEDLVRCTPLEYSWHDGALWIFTEGGKKFHALRKSPHAAAAIFDTESAFGGLASLQIEGEARTEEPFSDAYNAAAAFRHIPLETLRKLPEPMWLIRFVPLEYTCLCSEFKKQGYGVRQRLVAPGDEK